MYVGQQESNQLEKISIDFILDVWQEYMADNVNGLDFTPQLFFTGRDYYTDQMALLIDKNVTSCVTLTKCSDGSKYCFHSNQIL